MRTPILISLFLLCLGAQAQDERYLRDILSSKKKGSSGSESESKVHFKSTGPRYFFDLNGDDREESFYTAKLDGVDWLYLYDFRGNEVFRHRFSANGPGARIYKINLRWISKKRSVAMIHYFEGVTEYLEKRGTSRLYLLTFERGKLDNLKMFKGPNIWDEYRDHRKHYHQRKNSLSLFDFDDDGIRELSVRYNLITRVYRYKNGQWQSVVKKLGKNRL